jgi:hypothetical protein
MRLSPQIPPNRDKYKLFGFEDKTLIPCSSCSCSAQRLREQALLQAINGERRAALQSGVFAFIIVAIDLAVFAVHWQLAKRER